MINATPEERNAKREERKIKHDELFADMKAILKSNKTKKDNLSEDNKLPKENKNKE